MNGRRAGWELQNWVIRGLSYLMLLGALKYLLEENKLPVLWAVAFALLVAAADYIASARAELTGWAFANRHIVTLGVTTALIAVGIIALVMGGGAAPQGRSVLVLSQFALQGMVVGAVLRMMTIAVLTRVLKGGTLETHRLLLIAAILVLTWLFPLAETHRLYAGVYLIGVAAGFAIHFLVRHREHRQAQFARHTRTMLELLGDQEKLKGFELTALALFGRHDWDNLEDLVKEHSKTPTTVLALINASMLRIRGLYDKARTVVDTELSRQGDDRDHSLDSYLQLHRALSLSDLGLLVEAESALREAQACDKECLLCLVTAALRLAEKTPFVNQNGPDDQSTNTARKEALDWMWEAMKRNEVIRPGLIARMVGGSVPVTWTFLLDSYAYVLLKNGQLRFARALLTTCIYEDPYFSAPYLHLGEWCIADILRSSAELERADVDARTKKGLLKTIAKSRRVGVLSLNIARHLEGRRESLTRRRAIDFLELHGPILRPD